MPLDVQLRATVDEDLPILFEQQRDRQANEMAAFAARDWDAFAAHEQRVRTDPTVIDRTILLDGRVAGSIVSWSGQGERDVGYWIGREFWGRGVATLALKAFLEIELTRPLTAHAAKHNVGSIRVLEKCGFRIVGERGPVPGDEVEEVVLRLD